MHETLVHVTGVGSNAVDVGIAAAAGIFGAVLGATTGGGINFWLEKRREATRARAGARLLRADFEHAAAMFGVAQASKRWILSLDVEVDGWDDFRDVLAAQLDSSQWDEVDTAVRLIRSVQEAQEATRRQYVSAERPMPPSRSLDAQEIEQMGRQRNQARLAYNVLAQLARGQRAGETFGLPADALSTLSK
jgi:hypothetical protein